MPQWWRRDPQGAASRLSRLARLPWFWHTRCQRGQILPNGSLWKDMRMSKSVADFDDVRVDTEGMRTIDA